MKRFVLHPQAFAAALLSLTLLGGCGPGTGGTGTGGETGSVYLGAFAAQPASVCGTALAQVLQCGPINTGTASGNSDPILQGTLVTNFNDAANGGDISVAIEANSIQLESPCKKIRFEGDWGIAAMNDARFFGRFTTAQSTTPAPGTLSVESIDQLGASLAVTVRQADGRIVLGPVVLARVPVLAPQPATCP
jgi:hypothetical protein